MKCIKKFLESNQKAVLSTGISNNSTQEEQNEIVEMILELLEFRIKPTIQEDGGDIHYKKYDHESGLVYIKLAGSCVGCPSSSITLKLGVENMFKHYIPEVKGVINVGDRDDDENDEEDLPEITLTEKIDVKPKPVPWKENQI